MKYKVTAVKYFIFILGLFLSALGIAFTKQGDLGMSTVSSPAYVLSMKFTAVSFGMWSTITNVLFVAGQILLLRKRFQPIQLLQIPFSFVFGWFTDFGVWLVSPIPVPHYAVRALMVLIGIVVLALGITLAVIANVMYNSGEGLVKAISDVSGWKFGNVKIAFDLTMVATAAVLSLCFFGGRVLGIREGTLVSAVLTGLLVKLFTKWLSPPVHALLSKIK